MSEGKFQLAVFISGRGSNFMAIVEAIEKYSLDIEVALVLSNTKKARGLEFAKEKGFSTEVVPRRSKTLTAEQYDQALVDAVEPYKPDLIVLAGFMRVVGPKLIGRYRHRIINIHPSLLPSFRGLDVQKRAIEAGVKFSGCSVHYVIEEVDAGPIIGQAVVPILPDDTADELAARILRQEHRLYPAIVSGIASGNISVVEEMGQAKVKVSDALVASRPEDCGISIGPLDEMRK